MNGYVWAARIALATVFLVSGVLKSILSKERLVASGQTGVQRLRVPTIRFIAACELAGAVGLIAPVATRIAPVLTTLTALSLGVIMVLAAVVHWRLREPLNVLLNTVLLATCLFVAAASASSL